MARELVELTGAITAVTYLASPDVALSLAGMAGSGRRERLASAPGIALRAFSTLGSITANPGDLRELQRLGVSCGHALAVPLVFDGESLGALLLAMPGDAKLTVDEEFVADIAALAASACASERRLSLTHAEARRDALTGLPNRRAYEEHLDEVLHEAAGHGGPVCVVLFDLDDFKRWNDAAGHAAGDEVLTQVGRTAARILRAREELFRVGGDEFAVVVAGGAAAGEPGRRAHHGGARGADPRRRAAYGLRRCRRLPGRRARRRPSSLIAADNALYAVEAAQPDTPFPQPASWRYEAGTREPADHPPVGSRGARVLFVDDDPGLLQAAEQRPSS